LSKTRQALSSSDWVAKDSHFEYRDFMDRILQLFKDPELVWVRNTLNWWNKYTPRFLSRLWLSSYRQVDFTRSKTSGGETDASSDDEHAVSVEDLLRSADDEEIEVGRVHDQGGNHGDDAEWPEAFRMDEELPTTQEPEVVAAREPEAQEPEVTAVREPEVVVPREREVPAVQEPEVVVPRECEVPAVHVAAAVQERETDAVPGRDVAAAREPETVSSGKQKRRIEADLSDLSDEDEPLPPPQPVRTKQTNRGTGRQPPPKRKKK
jgi:hypothetical protein